jgi:cytochrome c oxidase subunit 2
MFCYGEKPRMKYVLSTFFLLLLLVFSGTGGGAQTAPRRIEIHAKRFSFQPSEITVSKGEPVTLALTSEDVNHALVIPGLKVNAPISKGHVTEITFTPDKAGDFNGKCGRFCGSGHGSMLFVVHVTDK